MKQPRRELECMFGYNPIKNTWRSLDVFKPIDRFVYRTSYRQRLLKAKWWSLRGRITGRGWML